ncbi:MAG: hypothetical protein JWL74_1423 [Alphaproteobacteria bacterium]|nr:hypothetical protein [Alphaproteobacteria bacterium]
MKKTIILAFAGAAFFALPAQAQILGGGGLGGQVGGILSGGGQGGVGGLGQTVGGTLSGRGASGIRLDRQIDRRQGRASARGSGSAQGDALLGGATNGVLGSGSGSASGSAGGSGEAGIGLQAIGTDQLRSTAGGALRRTRNLAGGAAGNLSGSGSASGSGSGSGSASASQGLLGNVSGALGGAGSLAGRGSSGGSGTGSNSSSGGGSLLGGVAGTATGALSGAGSLAGRGSGGGSGSSGGGASGGGLESTFEGAADAAGSVSLEPGMIVRDASGRVIGRVLDFQAAANGLIETVLVRVGDRVAALPANNFTVSGDALVSAMSRGEVRREAAEQEPPAQ